MAYPVKVIVQWWRPLQLLVQDVANLLIQIWHIVQHAGICRDLAGDHSCPKRPALVQLEARL